MKIKNIRKSLLFKNVEKELSYFELHCRNIMKDNMKIWRLESVPEVFEIGKGIRPALYFFFRKAINKEGELNFLYALVVEMLHFATLTHDDVLDEALLRRLNGTLKATWGNFKAILIGDLIFSLCYKIASQLQNPQFIKLLSQISHNVCIGEIMQHNERFNLNLTEAQYRDIIYYKTAVLFGLSCCLADFEGKYEKQLFSIGTKIGVLYQVVDDFLDIYSSHKVIGKSTGKDFCKGNITLPIIMLLKIAQPADLTIIKNKVLNPSPFNLAYIKNLLKKYKIRNKIYQYLTSIYKETMREAENILDKEKINILGELLKILIQYI